MCRKMTARVGAVSLLALSAPHIATANGTFDFYGHLNFGVFNYDDGTDNETAFLDNDFSNSRIGIWYRIDMADGSEVSFNLETALGLAGSSAVTIDNNDFDIDTERTDFRKIEVIYKTTRYGTFYAGQGSMSADDIAHADFSGTTLIAYSSFTDLAFNIALREKDQDPSATTIGSVFKSFDGGRRLRLRYDTASFNGFMFSVSYGEEWLNQSVDRNFTDVAALYANDYGDLKVDGRIGYQWIDNDDMPNEELLAGSVAVLHKPSGFSLAFAAGTADEANSEYIYAKLGYQQDWFQIGKTALSIDFYDGNDFASKGSDSNSWSVAVVQNIERYNVELFATYRNHDFDASGSDFEDVDVFAAGARWTF